MTGQSNLVERAIINEPGPSSRNMGGIIIISGFLPETVFEQRIFAEANVRNGVVRGVVRG